MRFFALSLLATLPLSLTTHAEIPPPIPQIAPIPAPAIPVTATPTPVPVTESDPLEISQSANTAVWQPDSDLSADAHLTTKIQALLDRSHASPGPIDGQIGSNTRKAIRAFEQMRGLPVDGEMDIEVWQALQVVASAPILTQYSISSTDATGPFLSMPRRVADQAKMRSMAYGSIVEMLGEKFHMHVNYLRALNPDSRFAVGDSITVIDTGRPAQVAVKHLQASKSDKMLYAYDANNQLVAAYPTTIGAADSPSPSGTHRIAVIVANPKYKWSFGKETYFLPAGPNNPVGTVWLGLSKRSYGIHGSPSPEGISRQASHGCVRLTNWDVQELMTNVKAGVSVRFVD